MTELRHVDVSCWRCGSRVRVLANFDLEARFACAACLTPVSDRLREEAARAHQRAQLALPQQDGSRVAPERRAATRGHRQRRPPRLAPTARRGGRGVGSLAPFHTPASARFARASGFPPIFHGSRAGG